jgi:hypothetical protein
MNLLLPSSKFQFKHKLNFILIFILLFIFSGCANYKYTYGIAPYSDGYVVLRNNTLIPEYTIGRDKKAPKDLSLAKERFQRRRAKVEYYYKKMNVLYNPFSSLITYPLSLIGLISGIFKLPFIIISDYRYEHDPEYRERIDRLEEEKMKKEKEKRERLRKELDAFIMQDLQLEESKKFLDEIENTDLSK